MPKLPSVSGGEVVRALERAGFEVRRQRGSHVVMRKGGRVVVVPVHGSRAVKRGTLRGIIRDAGLSVEEFVALLERK